MKNNAYKKVLLVNPPSASSMPVLPLGLASVAAYLISKNKDIDISAIDGWVENMGLQELENRVSQNKADIIGVHMASACYEEAKFTIEACRRALPEALIIAGGPHPSALPQETLNEIPCLDICVIGEGEITMDDLVKSRPLPTINGIAYRDGKEIKLTPPRDFIINLDELPFPARELFPWEKYRPAPPIGKKKPCFIMITSRGCPFQCVFCSKPVFKDMYRTQSPKRVADEIEELISKYHAQEIPLFDDDFTINIKRAEEICDEILRRRLKFRWGCQTRVDRISEQLLKKMKLAGCQSVAYGVESGNQQILDSINKGFTVAQVISAFEMTKKAGLETSCNIIFGLPGETKQTIQETINLVKKIKADTTAFGVLTVYPSSRLFRLIKEGKYPGKLRILGEGEKIPGTFFKGNHLVFEQNLTFEELREAAQKANREFYLRPQYIIRALKNMRSFSDFKYYLNGLIKVAKAAVG